jgi:adenylate cyclase
MVSQVQRRLAAVLAADVVGYSRLMRADETGTLARLQAARRDLIDPAITAHRGRIVKLMGDGALVEFASVVDAVACAVAIQEGAAERNVEVAEEHRIVLRIGINLGDVILDGDDIYGDGVNIAARLEALAEPGGICLSEVVHTQVVGRLDAVFTPGGRQQVKNIDRPIETWIWSSHPTAVEAALHAPSELADKPSLVVLPFLDLTGRDDGIVMADGFTEDLITAVSRMSGLFVIARNSAFSYKGRSVDVKQIAGELGVRYVIEGSIRRLGNRFRINAQLIDTQSGHHLWAEVYDLDQADFDAEQDDVIRSIAASVQTQFMMHEGQVLPPRPRVGRTTQDLLRQAWTRFYQLTPDGLRDALDLADAALRQAPDNDRAHVITAAAMFRTNYLGYTDSWKVDRERARRAAERAIEIHESDEYSHWALGLVLMLDRDHEGAVAELTRALEINANFSLAYGSLGTALAWAGRAEEALVSNQIALRANPRDPANIFRFCGNALAHFTAGRYGEAETWATRAVRAKRTFKIPHLFRVAALALSGELDRARTAADDLGAHVTPVTRSYVDSLPFVRDADRATLLRGLEIAGVLS